MEAGPRSEYRSKESAFWPRCCVSVGNDTSLPSYFCVLSPPDLGLLQEKLWRVQTGRNGIRSCDSQGMGVTRIKLCIRSLLNI